MVEKTVEMIHKELCAPFTEDEIKWRVQSSGFQKKGDPWAKVMPYITSRAMQKRLDSVMGVAGWEDSYTELSGGGMLCRLTLIIDGTKITKTDGAGATNIEREKGAISGAFKRAGAKFGIGRYIYDIGDRFAVFVRDGKYKSNVKDKSGNKSEWLEWNPPAMPDWALPCNKSNYEKASDYKNRIMNEFGQCQTIEEADRVKFHYRDAIDRIRARKFDDLALEIDTMYNDIKQSISRNQVK